MKTRIKVILAVLAACLCLLVGAAAGSADIGLGDTLAILLNRLTGRALPERVSAISASIIMTIRLPRAVMAFLVGAGLSVSGAVMQSVLRNPLASSYTLGVSSGASLAAAAVMVTGFSLPLVGALTLPLAGFLGGLVTVLCAMALASRFDRSMENATIILTGMVLSLFINAFLSVLTAVSSDHLKQLVFWQMGSFSGQTWTNAAILAPILLAGTLLLTVLGRELDLLTFGEEQALSAGVNVRRVKTVLILVSALMTGSSVAFVGVIGFVDLIVPHAVRRVFGSRHSLILPMSALLGGGFMVLSDLAARTLMSPRELPVGAVTALIGAPFFAWIYFGRRRRRSA